MMKDKASETYRIVSDAWWQKRLLDQNDKSDTVKDSDSLNFIIK